jgi:hypothetical protein
MPNAKLQMPNVKLKNSGAGPHGDANDQVPTPNAKLGHRHGPTGNDQGSMPNQMSNAKPACRQAGLELVIVHFFLQGGDA